MSNYPPPHHQESSLANCLALVKAAPLATIISSQKDTICTTHTPLVYHPDENLGYFIGHIDCYNPQVAHLEIGAWVEIIFHGPETYISPTDYQSTQLPTWNYFKAHFGGKVESYRDADRLRDSLIEMTTFLEGEKGGYILEKTNPRMEKALPYIIGFKIQIAQWEGKYKISQDKHPKDQRLAKDKMLSEFPSKKALIDQLYQNHQTKR
ncbi:MAG: FMN-binding negative transcriptional regulator [Flavobacteriaceae bacterium]